MNQNELYQYNMVVKKSRSFSSYSNYSLSHTIVLLIFYFHLECIEWLILRKLQL